MNEQVTWRHVEIVGCHVLGVIHVALGLTVLVGGPARFPSPTYTELLILTNGSVLMYGLFWTLAGVLMILGHRKWVQMMGLLVSILITNLWSALFAVAVWKYPTAGATASVAYGGYGLISAVFLGFMLVKAWRRQIERGEHWTRLFLSPSSPLRER